MPELVRRAVTIRTNRMASYDSAINRTTSGNQSASGNPSRSRTTSWSELRTGQNARPSRSEGREPPRRWARRSLHGATLRKRKRGIRKIRQRRRSRRQRRRTPTVASVPGRHEEARARPRQRQSMCRSRRERTIWLSLVWPRRARIVTTTQDTLPLRLVSRVDVGHLSAMTMISPAGRRPHPRPCAG